MLCDVREHKLDLLSENEGKLNKTLRKCKLTGKLEKQKQTSRGCLNTLSYYLILPELVLLTPASLTNKIFSHISWS